MEDLGGIVSFFPHQTSQGGPIQEVSGASVPGRDTNTQRTAAEKTEAAGTWKGPSVPLWCCFFFSH